MQIESTPLQGLMVLRPQAHEDARGAFCQVMRVDELEPLGLNGPFVQMNHSTSHAGVLRGLHFQWGKPLGKFIRVIHGAALMAAVDIRVDSPTLGTSFTIEVSEHDRTCLWAPPGFATGFATLGERADVEYLYTAYYNAAGESAIRYDDPALGIAWPAGEHIVSDRDKAAGTLQDWLKRPEAHFFTL